MVQNKSIGVLARGFIYGALLLITQSASADEKLANLPGYRRPLEINDILDLFQGVIDCGKDVLLSGATTPTAITAYNKQWLLSLSEPDPPFSVGLSYRCLHVRITDISHRFTVLPPACLVDGAWKTYKANEDPIRWASARTTDDITVGKEMPQPYSCVAPPKPAT